MLCLRPGNSYAPVLSVYVHQQYFYTFLGVARDLHRASNPLQRGSHAIPGLTALYHGDIVSLGDHALFLLFGTSSSRRTRHDIQSLFIRDGVRNELKVVQRIEVNILEVKV